MQSFLYIVQFVFVKAETTYEYTIYSVLLSLFRRPHGANLNTGATLQCYDENAVSDIRGSVVWVGTARKDASGNHSPASYHCILFWRQQFTHGEG